MKAQPTIVVLLPFHAATVATAVVRLSMLATSDTGGAVRRTMHPTHGVAASTITPTKSAATATSSSASQSNAYEIDYTKKHRTGFYKFCVCCFQDGGLKNKPEPLFFNEGFTWSEAFISAFKNATKQLRFTKIIYQHLILSVSLCL